MRRFRVADDDEEPSAEQCRSGQAFPWGWVAVSTILNVLFIFNPGITGLSSIWSMAEAASDPLGRGHCPPMRIGIQLSARAARCSARACRSGPQAGPLRAAVHGRPPLLLGAVLGTQKGGRSRSEEHTSETPYLMPN